MSFNVRIVLKDDAVSQGTYAYHKARKAGSLSRSHTGYFIDDSQQDVLGGSAFRTNISAEDVALVTARGVFFGNNSTAAPEYVRLLGVGNFKRDESFVRITRNDSHNGWNLSIESPSVAEFNKTITALRNGDIKPEGCEQTVMERITDKLAEANELLNERARIVAAISRFLRGETEKYDGPLFALDDELCELLGVTNDSRKKIDELARIKSGWWYRMKAFFTRNDPTIPCID